jgi:hypothetical protein
MMYPCGFLLNSPEDLWTWAFFQALLSTFMSSFDKYLLRLYTCFPDYWFVHC